MKSLFLSATTFLALTVVSFAQSQRLVLIEEFTNASCTNCGTANPAFNTLLDANPTKVVALKYHFDQPGKDTINQQSPTIATARQSVYGIPTIPPIVRMDGVPPKTGANGSLPGAVTQAIIDAQYAVAANFDIQLLHTFSDDMDSVFIYGNITCTKATPGTLKAYVALSEEIVSFPTPPNGNNEKDFYDVARAFYPDNAGTTLPVTLGTLGQSMPFAFAKPIPTFVQNKSNLRVVAFIQGTGATKTVYQAAYSPIPALNDAGMNAVTISSTLCGATSFTVPFEVKNTGQVPLQSLQIWYSLDNGAPQNIPSGVSQTNILMPGTTKSITTSAIPVGPGAHTIKIYTVGPNSQKDGVTANDTITRTFVNTPVAQSVPFSHNFAALTTLDPSLFVVNNPVLANATWQYSPFGVYNTGSVLFPFFDVVGGNMSELIFPPYNTTTTPAPLYLTFDLAHAPYTNPNGTIANDTLAILASTDCGFTWTTLWEKTSNNGLATVAPISTEFLPSLISQWKNISVDISSFIGLPSFVLKFQGRSGYGNSAFVDNIKINASSTAIEQPAEGASALRVTPNPFAGTAAIQFTLSAPSAAHLMVYNTLGETVLSQNLGILPAGEQNHLLDGSAMAAGVYSVVLEANGQVSACKVMILGTK